MLRYCAGDGVWRNPFKGNTVFADHLSQQGMQAVLDCKVGDHGDTEHQGDGAKHEPQPGAARSAMTFHIVDIGEHLELLTGFPYPA